MNGRHPLIIKLLKAALLAMLLLPATAKAAGTDAAVDVSWGQLVPAAAQPPVPDIRSKGFLAGARPRNPADIGAPPIPQSPEAGWMSYRSQQPGTDDAPAVVAELDGKRIRIGGYVVPLDFDATKIKEFLLVPFVGACIHVPPPPPNQIIYVKADEGFEVAGQFDPVYVTGTLKTARQFTGPAATGYTMEADRVEARKQ
jgi:uncharacterized protein